MKNGYLTVEASLVLPIVIFTLMTILFLFFYQYNLIYIKGTVDDTLLQLNMQKKELAEEQIQSLLKEKLENKLYFIKMKQISVKKRGFMFTVEVVTENHIPGYFGGGIYNFGNISTKILSVGKRHKPKDFVVTSEITLDLLSKVKGVSAYIE